MVDTPPSTDSTREGRARRELKPPAGRNGCMGIVLLILGLVGVAILLAGGVAWRLGLLARVGLPYGEHAGAEPPPPPPIVAIHGTYQVACTPVSPGLQPLSLTFETERGCADGTLAYTRTAEGYSRLEFNTATGAITRVTLSADLTTYSRGLFSPSRAAFNQLGQTAVSMACANAGDQPGLAQLAAQLRAQSTAAAPLLAGQPGANAVWRCTTTQTAPPPAAYEIPAPTQAASPTPADQMPETGTDPEAAPDPGTEPAPDPNLRPEPIPRDDDSRYEPPPEDLPPQDEEPLPSEDTGPQDEQPPIDKP